MKRLYFLTNRIDRAESISAEIHEKGVRDWNFHIMSRDKKGLTKHQLHSTNSLIHERDAIRIGERGAIIGVVAGLLASLGFFALTSYIPIYRIPGEAIMLFFCVSLAVIGAILGSMFGLTSENAKIRRFHDDLDAGSYLLMIDVRKRDAPQIEKMMSQQEGMSQVGEGTSIISPFQVPVRS